MRWRLFISLIGCMLTAMIFVACRTPSSNSVLRDTSTGTPDVVNELRLGEGGPHEGMIARSESANFVKFVVTLSDKKVWFQNTTKYPYHFSAASVHIPQFQGVTAPQFDAATLKNEGRIAISGTVLLRTSLPFGESGIQGALQLVGAEPLDTAFAIETLQLVRKAISVSAEGSLDLYFPTMEQTASATTHASEFTAAAFRVSSIDDWIVGNACYSHGWAASRRPRAGLLTL